MSRSAPGHTWEEAASPVADQLVRQFEADWRASDASQARPAAAASRTRPDPANYLPGDPHERTPALLALLRAELTLRFRAGESARVEEYRHRHPELAPDALVALAYEEFCLREEAGEAPDPAEYEARFSDVAAMLREVLDIHGLIVEGSCSTARVPEPPSARLPEAGQVISGFTLVEELGRGTFARVFLAREQQLADRPVALKVARAGSREPQTLARLQHTHIVPVYSYRVDPATGLHLLCMPYLGRVTLADLLAELGAGRARSGADLVAALDRLEPPGDPAGCAAGRRAVASRPYDRAIAWWGARLAEALQFAHERDVLHRDLKPSNVLVTGEGMPMLLDFNLAGAKIAAGNGGTAGLGGTLAYMAPEHLEALAGAPAGEIDHRADLYALGVVLFQALGGQPFPPRGASTAERLRDAIAQRRAGAPRLRDACPGASPALEAVVRKCLEPKRDDRYAIAANLATDLQAVADGGPLRYTSEPLPSRASRALRRNARGIAAALIVVVVATLVVAAWLRGQAERLHQEEDARHRFWLAEHSEQDGQYAAAAAQFTAAADLVRGRRDLRAFRDQAMRRQLLALRTHAAREQVDALLRRGDALRFGLMGLGGDPAEASLELESALRPFGVLDDSDWDRRPDWQLLGLGRREQLRDEVNDLLFLWVVASDRPGELKASRRAVALCDRALTFAEPRGPWLALRARHAALTCAEPPPPPGGADDPARATSARACFQRSLLCKLAEDRAGALVWLERAVQLRPDDYWYQFALAYQHDLADHVDRALTHYEAALALRPASPWALANRAHLLWSRRGAWGRARRDLERALEQVDGRHGVPIRLEYGLVLQRLGDFRSARAAYARVLAQGRETRAARIARLNLAKLEADSGAPGRARAAYDALLAEDPGDRDARRGRAVLALRLGRAGAAEADLTWLLRAAPGAAGRAEVLAYRAMARLLRGLPEEAEADAAEALRLDPGPGRSRPVLWRRAVLASGGNLDLRDASPDEFALWPVAGHALEADLLAAADRLRAAADGAAATDSPAAMAALRTRAVLLSALGRHEEAEAEASRAVARAPLSAPASETRARVRHRRGDRPGALADVAQGLALEPDDARLRALGASLALEAGDPGAALAECDRASSAGAPVSAGLEALRARALMALGRPEAALDAWSRALGDDPEDARFLLGRARAFTQLGLWDQALADLERAADDAGERPGLLERIALAYGSCLIARPARIDRVLALARRAGAAWLREILSVTRGAFLASRGE
jgi:eukaryotic-like serine/threonine-protein kinase